MEIPEYCRGGDTLINLPGVHGFVLTGEDSAGAPWKSGQLRDCLSGSHEVGPHAGFHRQQTQGEGFLEKENRLPPEDPDLEVLSERKQEVWIDGEEVGVGSHYDVISLNLRSNNQQGRTMTIVQRDLQYTLHH